MKVGVIRVCLSSFLKKISAISLCRGEKTFINNEKIKIKK